MAADTRSRMIDAAVTALQRRGAAGTSFTEVLQASGAARGAIYHHFPGGKAQLLAEATRRNGEDVRAALAALPPGVRPADVVGAFLDAVRPVVTASAAGGGCAVAAATVEAEDAGSAQLRDIAAAAFTGWTRELARHLADAGLAAGPALDLATTLVTLLEGAHVMCRAAGTPEPFERAARTVQALVDGLPATAG